MKTKDSMTVKRLIFVSGLCALIAVALVACTDDDNPAGTIISGGGKLYVLNQADQTIHILNASTLALLDSFPTPVFEPHYVQFSHDGAHYYVVGRDPGGLLAKYRTSDDSLVDTVRVIGSVFPTALVLSANDDTAYVCDFTNAAGRIHRYDVSGTNFVFLDSNLQSGYQGHDIDIAADGSRLVAAGFNSDELTFVDVAGGTGVTPYLLIDGSSAFGSAPATYGPYGVNFNRSGTKAVAACRKGVDQIRIMDIANPTLIDSIVLPITGETPATEAAIGPTLMVQKPNSDVFFVSGYVDNRLYVVDIGTLTVLDTIRFATSRPFTVAINSAGTRVYVSTTNTRPAAGRIYVLDANTYQKIDSVLVGSEPFGCAWRPN